MNRKLNTSLGGFSFGLTTDGKPGYREAGADTVTPFKGSVKGDIKVIFSHSSAFTGLSGSYTVQEDGFVAVYGSILLTGGALTLKVNNISKATYSQTGYGRTFAYCSLFEAKKVM